ncbi:hypothetical protein FTUN_1996 [Frigoriglobus tundricola]|uniref:Uncharacterized protein n=1 Tax=Frigoriglobus tundricola TaxID=2774151 RepID=A0A6M5YMA9_9BACT|nr:hypothetical protein FTUN_1996 [Frigoriglobus tundricola]
MGQFTSSRASRKAPDRPKKSRTDLPLMPHLHRERVQWVYGQLNASGAGRQAPAVSRDTGLLTTLAFERECVLGSAPNVGTLFLSP